MYRALDSYEDDFETAFGKGDVEEKVMNQCAALLKKRNWFKNTLNKNAWKLTKPLRPICALSYPFLWMSKVLLE